MDLEKFIEKNKKDKSVFEKFREDIFLMVENNVSQRSIIIYLKTKTRKKSGLTQPNLNQWLKRQKDGRDSKKNSHKVDFFASKSSAEHHPFSSVPSQENNHEEGDSYRIKVPQGRSKALI